MPITRPTLHLTLTAAHNLTGAAAGQQTSTRDHLYRNLDRIREQIRDQPAAHFREDPLAPDYRALHQMGFATLHNGFMLSNSGLDAFMQARREQGQCAGVFDGDKFHLSVKPEQVPDAFNALSGLLCSEDSPIDRWKVTDMQRVEPQSLVSVGAQFTLYAKPDAANSHYTARGLNNIRHFVEKLERTLTEHGIEPGQAPESDVRFTHWQFSSYRNELRSQRDGSEEQTQALGSEPFYQLLAE